MAIGSLRSGHIHGLMVRAVMSAGSASTPKKGKVPKPTEERSYRCLCRPKKQRWMRLAAFATMGFLSSSLP